MTFPLDVTNEKYGLLTAIEPVEVNGVRHWKCLCDCGNTRLIKLSTLRTAKNPSCGCIPLGHLKICPHCGIEFYTQMKKQVCCSCKCSHVYRFIANPDLKQMYSDRYVKLLNDLNTNGKAYRMPPGTHTEEFKTALALRSKQPRSDETKNKIRDNHWSRNLLIREDVINRMTNTTIANGVFDSYERRYALANYMMNNPDCVTSHKCYKVGHFYNETNGILEFHHSGYELSFMQYLSTRSDVVWWTKKHKIFIEYEYDNSIKKYWPDFLIQFVCGATMLVELKGYDENITKLNCKIEAGMRYCTDHNLTYQIIYQKDKHGFANLSPK